MQFYTRNVILFPKLTATNHLSPAMTHPCVLQTKLHKYTCSLSKMIIPFCLRSLPTFIWKSLFVCSHLLFLPPLFTLTFIHLPSAVSHSFLPFISFSPRLTFLHFLLETVPCHRCLSSSICLQRVCGSW